MTQTRSPRRFAATSRRRLALGGLAAASVSLAGCGSNPDPEPAEFTSVSACMNAGFPADLCGQGYDAAEKERQASSPKFASKEECEKEWGDHQCSQLAQQGEQANSGGHSFFGPMLAGFVLSRAMQSNYGGWRRGDSSNLAGAPIYRNRTGATVTLDRTRGKFVAKPVNVNTRTVASRGFGSTGSARGFGGGSSGSRGFGG